MFSNLFHKKVEFTQTDYDTIPKGIYLYGDVGCGKTMLMDLFYSTIPKHLPKKRLHFHQFMQNLHKRSHQLIVEHGSPDLDTIPIITAEIAQEATVLCFDEFQVTDVADAMLLRRLLTRAIDELPLKYAIAFVRRFADIEIKLNEFERARELLKYGALQQSPIKNTELWEFWSDFEVAHGNKETYKAMLRIKRQATEEFNTDILSTNEPVGFVKSSEGPKVSSINASAPTAQANESNPDAIDLDI